MRNLARLCGALCLASTGIAADHVPLFDGRSLAGWVAEGPRATFSARDGELVSSGEGNAPNWLRTAREYENFRLQLEYRLERWGQFGVILRAPRSGRPARAGIAIMLAHDFHPGAADDHTTGGILGAAAPLRALPASFGEWHRVEILLDGAHLHVAIDGITTQDRDLDQHPDLRHRLRRGYIGFPDLGHPWRLRNLRLADLGDPTRYVEPFNGRDLDNWTLRDGGDWKVREGAIVGADGHGILYAPVELADFELSLLVRTHDHVNSGIFLRGLPQGARRGFEIQIYSPPDAVDYTTGSIYGLLRARPVADHEGQWLLMQVRIEGRHCVVRLDGETVAESDAVPIAEPGRIGLQIHSDKGAVEFSDLRVRLLGPQHRPE